MTTRSLPYGIQGEQSKRLVKAVSDYRQTISEYCGTPTFDYIVEDLVIDRNSAVFFPVESDEEDVKSLKEYLVSQGFFLPGEGNEPLSSDII